MCSGDAFPGHNAAKCWGFTSLAFSVLCLLGGVNVFIANGNTGVVIGALGQGSGGLLMIRAASVVVGCGRDVMTLPSQGATSLELDGAQGQANASRARGIFAVVCYFISVIGWILSLPLTMQCANVEGCVRGSELSRVPGAIGDLVSRGDIPAQCSISDCMELGSVAMTFVGAVFSSNNVDCISSKAGAYCTNNTVYLSTASAHADGTDCYPLLCCLPGGATPPTNFVPQSEHTCPYANIAEDPGRFCLFKEFCQTVLPLVYGTIGFMVLVVILGIMFVVSVAQLKSKIDAALRSVGDQPGVPMQPTSSPALAEEADFVPSATFAGARPGYSFKSGAQGTGYYRDATTATRHVYLGGGGVPVPVAVATELNSTQLNSTAAALPVATAVPA